MFNKKEKIIIKIDGMSCSHCAKKVSDSLSSIKDISKVKVDVQEKQATITVIKDIEDKLLKETIENLGYKVIEIIRK